MKTTTLLLAFLLLLGISSCKKDDKDPVSTGPQFTTLANKVFGGNFNNYFTTIAATSDGGCILAGSTNSFDGDITINRGLYDGFIVKVDAAGIAQWIKTRGGADNDYITKIITTTDGGYLIAGISSSQNGDIQSTHGNSDAWIAKLDNAGEVQWSKGFGGSDNDGAWDVINTPDGGYLFVGGVASKDAEVTNNHGNTDGWIVKLSNSGIIQWNKTVGGSGDDRLCAIISAPDGSFLLAGETNSKDGDLNSNAGGYDGLLAKVNNNGSLIWARSYGGSAVERLNAIVTSTDGGFIAAGASASNDGIVAGSYGSNDAWVIKITNAGELQWSKGFGGMATDRAFGVIRTPDNNYLIAASSNSNDKDAIGNHGDSDALLVKFNNKGEKISSKMLGDVGRDEPSALISLPDNKYALAGSSPKFSSGGWFLKFE